MQITEIYGLIIMHGYMDRELDTHIKRQWKMKKSNRWYPKNFLEDIELLRLSEHFLKTVQKAVFLSTARNVQKCIEDSTAFQINHRFENV